MSRSLQQRLDTHRGIVLATGALASLRESRCDACSDDALRPTLDAIRPPIPAPRSGAHDWASNSTPLSTRANHAMPVL
jgi:hypothetical protein